MEQHKRRLTLNIGSYRYTYIDPSTKSIRLASITPGNFHDEISCEIQVELLGASPPFEALSYAWGSPVLTLPILVDGKKFHVTASLHSALRRLRKACEKRFVWIDQLCINQTDDEEKSHQVNLMSEIFHSAERVIIWLGDEEENPEQDFERPPMTIEEAEATVSDRETKLSRRRVNGPVAIKVLAGTSLSDWEKLCAALDFIYDVASGKHASQIPYFSKREESGEWQLAQAVSDGMALLMKRPWWNRIWVVQETVLARKVVAVIGSRIIPWSVIHQASSIWGLHCSSCCRMSFGSILESQQKEMMRFVRAAQSIQNARDLRESKALGLLVAVEMFKERVATDDRDKIFGLLGLVTWDGGQPVKPDDGLVLMKPDYSEEAIDVYVKLVATCIETTYSLHALVGMRTGRPYFPSWVPDLTVFENVDEETTRRIPYEFYTAWNWITNAQVHGNKALSVSGIEVDKITIVGDVCEKLSWHIVAAILQSWRDMAKIEDRPKELYVGGGTQEEAFVRCVTGDIFTTSPEVDLRRKLTASWRSWRFWSGILGLAKRYIWKILQHSPDDNPHVPAYRRSIPEDWKLFPEWLARMKVTKSSHCDGADPMLNASFGYTLTVGALCSQGRLFLTESGYMGIGPASTSIADEVFVLQGSCVPFVLQRSGSLEAGGICPDGVKAHCFTVIGDCYLQGIMDGEIPRKWPERRQIVWLL